MSTASSESNKVWSVRFLLFIAGLGGLLYGIDVGIIAGALPYLQATSGLKANEISLIVAAVLAGSVVSTLFAGMLADFIGRKWLMVVSGLLFVASIPTIALSSGYGSLLTGRLLQGFSGGLIGVVVPLYLAECLSADSRGKGTGIFQWLLTLGFVAAALIAIFFSMWLDGIEKSGDVHALLSAKDVAWRSIFWSSLPPGALFTLGSLLVPESPRWLFRRGRRDAALAALLRIRRRQQAELELAEMEETAAAEHARRAPGASRRDSLLQRKYVLPFVLACIILACNQLTGINSIIGYLTTILLQAGLSDVGAHWGNVIFSSVNFLVTVIGVLLVDRKGRKFLLSFGSLGIIITLISAGLLFRQTERAGVDCKEQVQRLVTPNQQLDLPFNKPTAALLGGSGVRPTTLVVIYSYGDYVSATNAVRSDDPTAKPIAIRRDDSLPGNRVESFFKNPFADLAAAQNAPLHIDSATITPVPSPLSGWLTALCLCAFMAFFAVGPGVCVWLALSELMPTRIRSNGMSVALLINQAVSTTIAAIFLPTVGKYGYATVFFAFAGATLIYFVTATFFLPETKGKTLEEIEEHFAGRR